MAKKEKPLADLSEKEFMNKWTALAKEVEQGKAKLKEFSQDHQRRIRLQQLTASMSPGDLELLQGMTPEGIESAEAVMSGEDN